MSDVDAALAERRPLDDAFAGAVRSRGRSAWRRFRRNRAAAIALIAILVLLVLAALAPALAPYSYQRQNLLAIYAPPSRLHLLGTDGLGRDIFSRLLYGARISLAVAFVTVTLVLVIGVPAGLAAGYYGGLIDFALMRTVDVLFAFPDLLLVIILSAYLSAALPKIQSGPLVLLRAEYQATGGLLAVVLALGLFRWLSLARIVRGQVLSLKRREFTESARAIGASDGRIMLQHLLPNALAPVIVTAALAVPQFILAEAGLSFIGLGARPPMPSWGVMIADGVGAIQSHPNAALAPGGAIALTLLCFNFLGDGLRDMLDPLMRR